VPPKQPSAQDQLGFALHQRPDLLKDRSFLDSAASSFLSRGLPDGVKWLDAGHRASQEGYMQALQSLMSDDPEGAVKAFAGSGKLRGVTRADQLTKLDDGRWEIAGENGKTMTIDPRQAYINLLPPKDFADFQMKMPYYKALADYQGGRNDAGNTRAEINAGARVEAAGIGADSRERAAEIRSGGAVAAAGVRAASRGTARGAGGAGANSSPYGGDKGTAKWIDDFEKHYMPMRDAVKSDGTFKLDPRTGAPLQEVDPDLAPTVRDMARINKDVLAAGDIHPQEAANVFTRFATLRSKYLPPKLFKALDKEGRIAIVENENGDPVKALGIMGKYRDASGQVRPMFFDLPQEFSDELVGQEASNRVEKQKIYPDESLRNRAQVEFSKRTAAEQARVGTAPQATRQTASGRIGVPIPAPLTQQ
jgi:hypothetical protein